MSSPPGGPPGPYTLFQGDIEDVNGCFMVGFGSVCAVVVIAVVQGLTGSPLLTIAAGLVTLFGGYWLGGKLARYLPDPYPKENENAENPADDEP